MIVPLPLPAVPPEPAQGIHKDQIVLVYPGENDRVPSIRVIRGPDWLGVLCGCVSLRPAPGKISGIVAAPGVRNGVLDSKRPVGTAGLPPVPLFPHEARLPEEPVHPGRVTVRPECQDIAQRLVSLRTGFIAGSVPAPKGGKLRATLAPPGLLDQLEVIQGHRLPGGLLGYLPLRSAHVLLQNCPQRIPALLQIPARGQGVAGDGHVFICCTGYVDFEACLLVIDAVPGLVILESIRHGEENAQALPAGGVFRVGVHGLHDIRRHFRQLPVVINTVVDVDSAQVTEQAHADPAIWLSGFYALSQGHKRGGKG